MIKLGLLRYQRPMLALVPRMIARGLIPAGTYPLTAIEPVQCVIAPPADRLVEQYTHWCGATDRYPTTLPPHLVSHWGLPIATRLLLQTPFPLARVLNQGVTIRIHGKLPRREVLHCRGSVQHITETDERIRMTVRLVTGTATQTNLVETDLHMVFIRANAPGGKKSARSDNPEIWHTVGHWQADSHDGLRFALLTGDFNPIHWLALAGRMSALRSKILHGFGSFARTFEQLDQRLHQRLNQQLGQNLEQIREQQRVTELDLRFLRPVPLPSGPLIVEQAPASTPGQSAIRVADATGKCYLAGSVSYRNSCAFPIAE